MSKKNKKYSLLDTGNEEQYPKTVLVPVTEIVVQEEPLYPEVEDQTESYPPPPGYPSLGPDTQPSAPPSYPQFNYPTTQDPITEHNRIPEGTCSICLEHVKPGSKPAVTTSCGHTFHRTCIDGWKNKKGVEKVCPLCRGSMRRGSGGMVIRSVKPGIKRRVSGFTINQIITNKVKIEDLAKDGVTKENLIERGLTKHQFLHRKLGPIPKLCDAFKIDITFLRNKMDVTLQDLYDCFITLMELIALKVSSLELFEMGMGPMGLIALSQRITLHQWVNDLALTGNMVDITDMHYSVLLDHKGWTEDQLHRYGFLNVTN